MLAIGGLREKALAAQRYGIKHVIIPKDNAREIDGLPASTREAVIFHPVETVKEALDIVLRSPLKAVVLQTEDSVPVRETE